MRWTERQRRMLAAMGVRLFEPRRVMAHDDEGVDEPETVEAAPRIDTAPPRATAARRPGRIAPSPPAAAVAPAGDVASMDWPALQAAVAGCRACGLCESRTQTVFGVGNAHAHLMIVGEAPGEQEDLQGEPFVGQAGKLLDNMLRAIGLTRAEAPPAQQVFIANTLKCRPPRNRNPEPSETARCAPYLNRQIELVQPRVVLAMGRFAAQALLATDEPIGKLRSRVHQRRGAPVVVTYHPAYLLRTLADKARAWDDLCLAATLLEQAR
ncbi:MAG: uracil-DNA glycosylase [Aquincola sp.]|nr:uracil-DNA glycosylase [Aquincola sp.]